MPGRARSSTLYWVAFLWNLFWGAPLLLAPGLASSMLGLSQPGPGLGELHARAGGLAIVLFGWIYLTIGGNPKAFRPFLLIAVVAKTAFFLLVAFVCFFHRELLAMLATAVGDLAFAALFYRDWRAVR